MLADGDHFIELEFSSCQFLKYDIGRHQLGEAGRFHAGAGFFVGEYLVGAVVDDDVGAGVDLRWARDRGCARWRGSGQGCRRGRRSGGARNRKTEQRKVRDDGTKH